MWRFILLYSITLAGEIYPDFCPLTVDDYELNITADDLLLLDVFLSKKCSENKVRHSVIAAITDNAFFFGTDETQIETDFGKFLAFNCYQIFDYLNNLLFKSFKKNSLLLMKRYDKLCFENYAYIHIQTVCSPKKSFIRLRRINETEIRPRLIETTFYLQKDSNNTWVALKNYLGEDVPTNKIWNKIRHLKNFLIYSCKTDFKNLLFWQRKYTTLAKTLDGTFIETFSPINIKRNIRQYRTTNVDCAFSKFLKDNLEVAICEYTGWGVSSMGSITIFQKSDTILMKNDKKLSFHSTGAHTPLYGHDVLWGLILISEHANERYVCVCTNMNTGENVQVTLPDGDLKEVENNYQVDDFFVATLSCNLILILCYIFIFAVVFLCISCLYGLKDVMTYTLKYIKKIKFLYQTLKFKKLLRFVKISSVEKKVLR
ncbi:membrane protein U21 [macacine betaherpesvirus 9]|uniref:Membrane protein U21 n=1 Tax=macacine betaherpesvirus 9 TaxID=2560568 RepID=A0A192XNX6_9BETA|nr:membrane protein U21 [macacine betaherpesvirus 9]ANC96551.1 membrane protein U21 [macacine betaherpesvirus 9]